MMEEKKSNKHIRILVSIGIFILLAVLPFSSWYYLQTGLNYRKELESEIVPMGNIEDFGIQNTELFEGKTTLWQLEDVEDEKLNRLYDQFKLAHTFQLLSNDNIKGDNVIAFDPNMVNDERLNHSSFVLIDSFLRVRNIYETFDDQSVKKIVAHTAITLPLTKKRDTNQYDEEGRR